MALHKVIGIETEFGIVHRGAGESNPVTASSMLINAYLGDLQRQHEGGQKVGWDFEAETPGNDARGSVGPAMPPEIETPPARAPSPDTPTASTKGSGRQMGLTKVQ